MTDLPEPLTPADCDLRDYGFMPLDIVRLFGSRFHAVANDSEWRAGVTLWAKSFHQVPAASIPDDDVELCRLAELGRDLKAWKKVKAVALLGWIKCSDGRLYHPVVAEKANDGFQRKTAQRARAKKANAARWGDGGGDKDESAPRPRAGGKSKNRPRDVRQDEIDASETQSNKDASRIHDAMLDASLNDPKGQGQLRDRKKDNPPPPEPEAASSAGAGLWLDRMKLIAAKVPNLDLTSPSAHNPAPLKKLEADGCDFDQDIFPALVAIGEAWHRPTPIRSLSLPSFADMAHANRERRMAGHSTADAKEWQRRLLNWRTDRTWHASWGPNPEQPGYLGPASEAA